MPNNKTVRFEIDERRADEILDAVVPTREESSFGRLWLLEKLFNDLPEAADDNIMEDIEEVPAALLPQEPASPTTILKALIAAGSIDTSIELPMVEPPPPAVDEKNDTPCDFCARQDVCFRCECGGVLCCDCYLELIEDGMIACRSCFDVRQVPDDEVAALEQLLALAVNLEALAATTPATPTTPTTPTPEIEVTNESSSFTAAFFASTLLVCCGQP